MRLLNCATLALLSTTALATNHGSWNEDSGHLKEYQAPQEEQPPYHGTPKAVVDHNPQHTWSPPVQYEYTKPVVEYTQPPMVHETSTPAIVHETTTSVKYEQPKPEHTPPPKYELDVQPPAEGPKTHTVTVGGDAGLVYTPEHVIAAVGDIVHFVFQKQNHSVTQSTFDLPCNRLETGEDSGLLPNPNNTVVPAPTWEYVVKDQAPTWWYCKQRTGTHCGKGMVFAINPTAEKTFATFKEKAIKLNGTEAVTTTAPAPEKTVTDVATTVTLINDDPKPTETNVPVKDKPYMAPGWNQNGNPSACNCACFCGIGSFPQGDGWGHYGGFGGSMAAPW